MEYKEQYHQELDKLDKLEQNYWQRWEACSQEDAHNEKYLRGVRWCMAHRLKLLAKLEQLDQQQQAQQTHAAAAATGNVAQQNTSPPKLSPDGNNHGHAEAAGGLEHQPEATQQNKWTRLSKPAGNHATTPGSALD